MRTRSSRFFVAESVIGAGWSAAMSGLVAVLLLSACPQAGMPEAAEDAGLPPILEAGMPIRTVGLFASCTPEGAGYTDVRCQDGLRCATVLVGDPASGQGALTQCVPIPKAGEALTEGKACAFDREAQPQTEPRRFWDQCAAGLICAPTPQNGLQCRRPCEIRQHGTCGKKRAVRTADAGLGTKLLLVSRWLSAGGSAEWLSARWRWSDAELLCAGR